MDQESHGQTDESADHVARSQGSLRTRVLDRRAVLAIGAAGAVTMVAAACAPPPTTTAPPSSTAPPPAPPTTAGSVTTTKPPATTTTVRPTTTTTRPRTTTTTKAPTTTTTRPPTTTTTTAPPKPVDDEAAFLHHARRLTFGATPAVMAELRSLGTEKWIDRQLAWNGIDESAIDPYAAKYPRVALTAAEINAMPDTWRTPYDMATAAVVRAVWGNRQLYELLCDFWSNHLNIDVNHEGAQKFRPTDDREVTRRHATGRFADMLVASAQSPAMLRYLDQAYSRADRGRIPNENYAREVLELHTVGVGGGYDEADVKEVAYLLSGWALTDNNTGTFTFRSDWHNMGPLATGGDVLGWRPNGLTGQAAGESFLVHLARHPKTATRLAHKLAVRFVGEHIKPTDAVVKAAAKAYTDNDTAITPMVRSLLRSKEFRASAGGKVRRPFEYLAACMRGAQLQFDPAKAGDLVWRVDSSLSLLGQVPYSWPAPNGYPDANGKWLTSGAMVSRWNMASYAGVGFWLGSPTFDATRLIGSTPPSTVGEALDRIAMTALATPLEPATRSAILTAVGQPAEAPWKSGYNSRGLVAYVLQSSANQVR